MSGKISSIAKVAVSAATFWIDRPYDYNIPQNLIDRVKPGVRVTLPFGKGNRHSEGIVLAIASQSSFTRLKTITQVMDDMPVLDEQQIKLALWMRQRFFCTVFDAVKAMLPAGLWYKTDCVYSAAEGLDVSKAHKSAVKAEMDVLDFIGKHEGCVNDSEIKRAFGDIEPVLKKMLKKGLLVTQLNEKRRVQDKTVNIACLAVSKEEAAIQAAQKKRRAPVQAAVLEFLCLLGRSAVSEIYCYTGANSSVIKRLVADGFVTIEADEVFRRPSYKRGEASSMPVLSEQQEEVYQGIRKLALNDSAEAALLFGVTGSGKTSVYIRIIEDMLLIGKSSILLVPEISLTPQMVSLFSSYFGENIAIMHSLLSVGERYDEWKRIKNGQAKVVIGTRSAVFAPVMDLGAVIIDEEQEYSYKSENSPRYHARDIAKYRCAKSKALLLLGSATPDIVSMYNAKGGRYHFFRLEGRYNEKAMPFVDIVDMKRELRNGNGGNISSVLFNELKKNLDRGEQSILFLNRRGTNKLIACVDCGFTYTCDHCSVSMTYHSSRDRLLCHYCGHIKKPGDCCPECGGELKYVGAGTQKIAEELSGLFPGTDILRLDADTVSTAGSHEALFRRFREQNIPIMVGTQMVTKGLNFENVTLVGVVLADQSLYSGDYLASERTFSLLTQVVGRSGRGEKPGRAVIQTFTPQNQTIIQAAQQDYDAFYNAEIQIREVIGSPPFTCLFAITVSGLNEDTVLRCCTEIRMMLMDRLGVGFRVLGPAPLFVVRVKNRFRYKVTLACREDRRVREIISDIIMWSSTDKRFKGISVFADANPLD